MSATENRCSAYWFMGDVRCGLKRGHGQPHHGAAAGRRFKWTREHPRPRDLIREAQ